MNATAESSSEAYLSLLAHCCGVEEILVLGEVELIDGQEGGSTLGFPMMPPRPRASVPGGVCARV